MFTYGDDIYDTIPIQFNFSYFHYNFDRLVLDTNGYIYFSGLKCCDITLQSYKSNAISGLNYDITTEIEGEIVYENLNSTSTDYDSIRSDLNRLNSTIVFVAKDIFRISYVNIPDFLTGSYYASFQIILARDQYSSSYVVLKFYSCLTGLNMLTKPGLYYLDGSGRGLSLEISNPCGSSNVNLTGTWVFNVTVPRSESIYFHKLN